MTSPTPAPDPVPSSLRYRVLVVVAIVLAAGALYGAVHFTDTHAADPVTVNGHPNVVEQVIPVNGSSELRQSEFGIDLAPGYDGALVVNGTEIPRNELRLVPAQNQIFFTPGPGKIISELPAGKTCVVAIVWRSADGRGTSQDQSFRWCFGVT
jgi:hypothetical protein